MTNLEQAQRVATVSTETGKVSYWQHRTSVYRLNEYETVGFDIYGLPLGARWECEVDHPYWKQMLATMAA